MNKDLESRRKKAKVDIESLAPDEAERIGEEVGKRIGTLVAETQERISKILDIYGLKATLNYQVIDPKTGKPLE